MSLSLICKRSINEQFISNIFTLLSTNLIFNILPVDLFNYNSESGFSFMVIQNLKIFLYFAFKFKKNDTCFHGTDQEYISFFCLQFFDQFHMIVNSQIHGIWSSKKWFIFILNKRIKCQAGINDTVKKKNYRFPYKVTGLRLVYAMR